MRYIASVSWGKDSSAMLLDLIRRKAPLDEVVFYDTRMEFQAIYQTRDQFLPHLRKAGIRYTELYPKEPFLFQMLEKPVFGRNGLHYGYSWCGGRCRWGTGGKIRALDNYVELSNAQVYVGLAADERERLEKPRKDYKLFPLADWGYTEDRCLQNCYQVGIDWQENNFRLYDILDRVSCWCCANKNLKELRNIYYFLPEYWGRLRELQSRTNRPMKGPGKSIFELEERFDWESFNKHKWH